MTTATLPKRPAKEVVSELPEQLYPCRASLIKLLSEHSAITAGIEEFESRLQRSELDLNFAIENDSDDIDVSRHQTAVSVFGLKLSAKRATLTKLASTIPQAIYSCSNEYSSILLDERNRRTAALSERIAKVLGADADRLIQGHFLDDILDVAAPIQAIDGLRFSTNLVGASDETVLTTAKHLLDCYSEILKAAKEQI